MIGRFIDDMCKAHPVEMLDVLGREFSDFGQWVSGCRGCLIGSVLLARGFSGHVSCIAEVEETFAGFAPEFADAAVRVGLRVGNAYDWCVRKHGRRMESVASWNTAHARLSRLIKARIERALGMSRKEIVPTPHAERAHAT